LAGPARARPPCQAAQFSTIAIVTAGQVGDITQAPALLEGQTGKVVLGDKAYDRNALRATILEHFH
jgi:hypothetical protein